MPNCRTIDPLVTPYVDRELPDADRRVVDEHLHVCAPCHSRVAAEQAVRDLVQARQPELHMVAPAPPLLRTKCAHLAAQLKADAASTSARAAYPPRTWTSRLAPMAMAASLVTV